MTRSGNGKDQNTTGPINDSVRKGKMAVIKRFKKKNKKRHCHIRAVRRSKEQDLDNHCMPDTVDNEGIDNSQNMAVRKSEWAL